MPNTREERAAWVETQLRELDAEREQLLSLKRFYRNGAPETNGAAHPTPRKPFQRLTGGATERILQVVSQTPGLPYSEIITRAKVGLTTNADHVERSLGSTIQSLVKRQRIVRRDHKHYPKPV